MHDQITELTLQQLAQTHGGEGMPDIGGLLNGAFSMAESAGAPSKELGMAKQAAGAVMPLISSFLKG